MLGGMQKRARSLAISGALVRAMRHPLRVAVRAVGTIVAPLREAPLKDNQHSLQFRRAPPSPAALPSRAALQSQPVSLPLALSPPPALFLFQLLLPRNVSILVSLLNFLYEIIFYVKFQLNQIVMIR